MDISFIVPTLNEEKYIEDCLKSIKNQNTSRTFEIIVCDACSTDKTIEIAKKHADKIITSKIKSVAVQRNRGAKLARGNYLAFIDADTQIPSDYTDTVIPCLEDGYLGVSLGFKFKKKKPKLLFAQKVTNNYLLARSLLGKATLPGFNTAMSKSVFTEVGGYRNIVLEDVDISRKLNQIGPAKYISGKKVITSARKLEKMGILATLRYYIELSLHKNAQLEPLKNHIKHKKYMHVR